MIVHGHLPRRRTTRKRGQALVEFAMVLPIFLLILSGICDFGFMLYNRMTVINSAREGARAAAMVTDATTIVSLAKGASSGSAANGGLTVTPGNVEVKCLQTSLHADPPATIDCGIAKAGDSVSVKVNYTYHTFFPLSFGSTFDLSSTVQMVLDSIP